MQYRVRRTEQTMLQRSPDLAVGEGSSSILVMRASTFWLQRSPDLAVGEGETETTPKRKFTGFNGAPTSRSGKALP